MSVPGGCPIIPCPIDNEPDLYPGVQVPRVISFSSGKGGVGKTNIVANLAYALSRQGKKVLILDADLALGNIAILLGLAPKHSMREVLSGEKTISEILVDGPGGMRIIPACSGVQELTELTKGQKLNLLSGLEGLGGSIDVLLIDTGAGISSNVIYFNLASQERVIIVTPEPASIIDACALIRVLATRHRTKRFSILVNMASRATEAESVFKTLSAMAEDFPGSLSLDYWGFVPYDARIPRAIKKQRMIVDSHPGIACSRQFAELAEKICNRKYKHQLDGNIKFFWENLLQL